MAIGTSIILLAAGAILRFAVYYSVRGVAIGIVGIVLMIAGALGLLLALTVGGRSRRRTVVQSGPGSNVTSEETRTVDDRASY